MYNQESVDHKKLDEYHNLMSLILKDLSIYKSKLLVPENIVLNPESIIINQGDLVIRDFNQPKIDMRIFGIPIIRSYDLDPNEFRIVIKIN